MCSSDESLICPSSRPGGGSGGRIPRPRLFRRRGARYRSKGVGLGRPSRSPWSVPGRTCAQSGEPSCAVGSGAHRRVMTVLKGPACVPGRPYRHRADHRLPRRAGPRRVDARRGRGSLHIPVFDLGRSAGTPERRKPALHEHLFSPLSAGQTHVRDAPVKATATKLLSPQG